jgi:NADH-quinone oxidoreductase subunit M
MTELHFPFLQIAIFIPLAGAIFISRLQDSYLARKWCAVLTGLTFVFASGAWIDMALLGVSEAADPLDVIYHVFGGRLVLIDEISAPLMPTVALLYFLTTLATLKTKMRRFSFSLSLVSEAIRLATFACRTPWAVVFLLTLGSIAPYLELRMRGKSTRVYLLHMLPSIALMVIGWAFAQPAGAGQPPVWWASALLLIAVLIRSGMVPVHCWMTDLFEKATYGTALLFVVPLTGAYAAVRLVLPIAPEWVLQSIGMISLVTVVYAAGMALVQREVRRFFCYLFLSHSALVFVGLEVVNPIGLTGALSVWLSIGLSLGGFGLTLRALESRYGRLSLTDFHGLYEHTPALAMCFALTGLASVGFPGTLGFVGLEMLVDGAVEAYPHVGITLVIAAALNGIAIVRAYFLLFTGTRHVSSVSLGVGLRERLAVLTLAAMILGGGIFPQPGVASRYHAAELILKTRAQRHLDDEPPDELASGLNDHQPETP